MSCLADRIGARRALLLSSIAFILGGGVAASSWSLASLIIGEIPALFALCLDFGVLLHRLRISAWNVATCS